MRKIILKTSIVVIVLLILSSCSRVNKTSEYSIDAEQYRHQNNSQYFVETDNGYYYMNPNGRRNIMFSERNKNEFYILCNKPDCSHSDENCNAYAGEAFGYYNNHLYAVSVDQSSSAFYLNQLDMDGSNHKRITRLPEQLSSDGGTRYGGGTYYFNNGYLIMGLPPIQEDNKSKQKYYKINLETGDTTELFSDFIEYGMESSWNESISNDKLYFVLKDIKTNTASLYEGDLNNGKITLTIENWNIHNSTPINFNDTLYYYKSLVGYCEYDKKTNTETIKYPANYYISQTVYTDDYILAKATPTTDDEADPEWDFIVLDREYNFINKCELRKGYDGPEFDYYADDKAFFSALTDGKLTHYIDLTKANRNLDMIEIKDPYSLR